MKSVSLLLFCCLLMGRVQAETADVVIAGATPAGVAAALNAADMGHTVALFEESNRIGGMLTGGLSYSDFRSIEAVQGTYRDVMERVEQHYIQRYGTGSPQVRDCYHGAHAEPHVALKVLHSMIGQRPRIRLFTRHALSSVKTDGTKVIAAEFENLAGGERLQVRGTIFIDATYEGDMAAMAGVEMRVGRESVREFGERLAGHLYFRKGAVLYGGSGEGDHRIQCYNFRVTMTDRADNSVPVPRPAQYDRSRYERLVKAFADGTLAKPFTEGHDGILRIQRIPNGKADINDINTSPIGFGLPGENYDYPNGNREQRRKIHERHRTYAQGLLYFVQNDPELPENIRNQARQWGLPRDEFEDSGNFPTALYVREARRMMGQYVFTQADVELTPGTNRARLQKDSIAIADYPLNSHGVAPAGDLYPDVREGYVVYGDLPYQVPYGVMVPKKHTNLLVPVAVSSSHVGFGALRMEPTWTAIGQAAGLAAHLALKASKPVQEIDVRQLQRLLADKGAATFYFSDVPRTDRRFARLQQLGNLGLFHEPAANRVLTPRRHRYGLQYFYPPENHAADLDKPLTEETAAYWRAVLEKAGMTAPGYQRGMTRGAFIEAIF